MQRLDLTLPSPAENLALDEALLDWAEEENPEWEFLRLWEPRQPLVVVGRSSRVHQEVNESACRQQDIPILRRSSGGAAIVAGPGCLMYALVLSYKLRPDLKDIRRAHACVLGQLADALGPMLTDRGTIRHVGTSDLALVEQPRAALRKFSGNSLRAKRSHLLYHGTLLYDFDLPLIETCLQMPPRQPEYRERRPHIEFVTNLPATRKQLVGVVDKAWPCTRDVTSWPATRVADLMAARFGDDRWNFEFS